jgi:hypothetical protein
VISSPQKNSENVNNKTIIAKKEIVSGEKKWRVSDGGRVSGKKKSQ